MISEYPDSLIEPVILLLDHATLRELKTLLLEHSERRGFYRDRFYWEKLRICWAVNLILKRRPRAEPECLKLLQAVQANSGILDKRFDNAMRAALNGVEAFTELELARCAKIGQSVRLRLGHYK